MSSTTWASRSSSRCVYCARPGSMRFRSLVNAHCRAANAPGPSTRTEPRCETSKTTPDSRQARCSSITPEYWIGISQPPNSAIRAPRARWTVSSGLIRRVSVIRVFLRLRLVGNADEHICRVRNSAEPRALTNQPSSRLGRLEIQRHTYLNAYLNAWRTRLARRLNRSVARSAMSLQPRVSHQC